MSAADQSIVILEGARRLPRADILEGNKSPGLFSRFSTSQLGGLAIRAALAHTKIDKSLIGHVVMGMAQHSHRDSIYGAQGMAHRGGLGSDVPALTVARICGSGAEAVAVGAELILAGIRHDRQRPFVIAGGAESMQYPFCLYNMRGKKLGEAVQKYGPIDAKSLPAGTHLQDMLLMSLYDPSAGLAMVIGRAGDAQKHDLKPLARIAGMGVAACDPRIMGWGPVPATERALTSAGISGKQVDHVELNEAFATQALAVMRGFEKLGIDPQKVNPLGGAVALGHPLGATGAILTITCAHALRHHKQRYGLVTMCIGGGQGISLVIEAA